MEWQQTSYTIPLVVTALILMMSAVSIWWRHRTPAARTLALVFLGGGGWVLAYALELAGADPYTKSFWYRIELSTVVIMSVMWFIFTLQYTGKEKWVSRRILYGLSILPCITLLLVFTNEYHGLVWSSVVLSTEGPLVVGDFIHSTWFWVHTAYSYILALCGAFLLIRVFIGSQRIYRWQIMVLLLAAFYPLVQSVLNLLGIYPLRYPRVTILLFPTVVLAVALVIFRFRLADIIPVAREAVIDSMSDGVIVLDPQNHVIDVNPTVQQLIGRPVSEILGKPIETVWPDWKEQITLSEGAEEEIVVGQKPRHTYDVRISPLNDWRGNLISQIVVLRDITERKEAETLLYESEEKFRTIFEHANDEIVYLNNHGTVIDINKKSEEIFGYNRDEIIGKNFVELGFLGTENISTLVNLFRDVVTRGSPLPKDLVELELNHKNGSKVHVEVSTKLIERNGNVEGILSIVRDVTERKQAEEKIKASLREKEILLQEIHHRVKNNLQVVSSLLSLQSTYIKDDQYKSMLKESQNRIKAMGLIHEKLYRSEILASIDFKAYIKMLVDELIRSYGVDTHQITVMIEVEDVFLDVDTAIPCGLIINELVSNSLKHAFPDGRKGEITLSLHSHNGNVILIVNDDGVGIPDSVDLTTTETLGLRLVSILVEGQLEGEITLTKREGTAFRITFRS